MGISAGRKIYPSINIGRTDGTTWVDVTPYVKSIDVDCGDVTSVGTQSGGDGVARSMTVVFQNPETGNLHPLDHNSSHNTFGGSYEPLLWSMRTIKFQVAITDGFVTEDGTTQQIDESVGTGDGTSTLFTLDRFPVLINSDTVYVDGAETTNYTIDYDNGTITTSESGTITATYAYYETVFEGYLGDSIKGNDKNTEITVKARDEGKILQNTLIESPSTQGSSSGKLSQVVIQDILTEYGLSSINLHVDASSSIAFAVLPYEVEAHQTVWDATQEVATQMGWYLGYRYDVGTESFRYTLYEPDRDKGSSNADWNFSDTTDFFPTPITMSDRDIRNVVRVDYVNSTGTSTSVSVQSSDSIAEFGRKAMIIAEGNVSLINTSSEATRLANYALEDLKQFSADIHMDMPLLPDLQLYDGVNVTHTQIASSAHFFAVNALKHKLRITGNSVKARTIWTGAGNVQGSHKRWTDMESRPGSRGEWEYQLANVDTEALWSEIVDDGGKPQDDATANPTYLSSVAPSTGTYPDGAIWIDSDTGSPYVYDGSSWQRTTWSDVSADPDAPVDNATKNDLIRQSTEPNVASYSQGDMWVDSDTGTPYLHDGSSWVRTTWEVISGDANAPADNADVTADNPQEWNWITDSSLKPEDGADVTADHALEINYYSTVAPSSPKEGWLWVDTDDSPVTLNQYNGTSWDEIATLGARWSEVIDDNGNMPSDNATENKTFAQADPPASSDISSGDIWIDTDSGSSLVSGAPYIYDGTGWARTTWTEVKSDPDAPVDNATKNDLIRQSTMPAVASYSSGDIWVDSDNGRPYIHDGSSWVTTTWTEISQDANAPADNADVTGDNYSKDQHDFDNKEGTAASGDVTINATGITITNGKFDLKTAGSSIRMSSDGLHVNTSQFTLSTAGVATFGGKITVAGGDVSIGSSGIEVVDGKFELKNTSNNVVIDGNSMMYKIHDTGTMSISDGSSGLASFTSLGYRPCCIAYMLNNSKAYFQYTTSNGFITVSETNRIRIYNFVGGTKSFRWYVWKEEAI